jgi:integrase
LPDGTTLHDLRRFLATTLEDLDVGQRTIGHILGHGAKNVTERYIRRNLPTMRRALEKLEAVIWAIDSQIDSQSAEKG